MKRKTKASVRFAEPDDLDEVLVMAAEFALVVEDPPPTIGAEQLLRDAFGPERWYEIFVVEQDTKTIGYAIVTRTMNPNSGDRGLYIEDFFLRKAARGKGAGRVLLAALAARSADLGGNFLRWDVWRENKNAIGFYRAVGGDDSDGTFNMVLNGKAFEKILNEKD